MKKMGYIIILSLMSMKDQQSFGAGLCLRDHQAQTFWNDGCLEAWGPLES